MFENEEWRPVEEFPKYLVSTHGRIKHEGRVAPRRTSVNEKGFPTVVLFGLDSHTRYVRHVNRIVATAFVPNVVVKDQNLFGLADQDHIWHKDGDLLNCHSENLMWATRTAVYEWNRMWREKTAAFKTPPVKNNMTGDIYANAFECGLVEGELESKIVWRIEKQAATMYDDTARYRYM